MKILITGLLVFLGWGMLSNYWYICRVKGLCEETSIAVTESLAGSNNATAPEESNTPPETATAPVKEAPPAEGAPPAETENAAGEENSTATGAPLASATVVPGVPDTLRLYAAFASSGFLAESMTPETLQACKEYMKQQPGAILQITGHTDNIGETDSNYQLGLERAQSLKNFLVNQQGFPAERLRATSSGETAPVASNASEEGRKANRRIELVMIPQ